MDELVEEFLVEAKDGLEMLDNDLLSLEKSPEDGELVDNLFRVMHTLKGTCGFLGLSRLASIAHAGENILDQVRDDKLKVSPEIVSALLDATDVIKDLISSIEESGEEPEGDDSALITKINNYAEGKQEEPVEKSEDEKEEKVEEAEEQIDSENIAQDSEELQALFDSTEYNPDSNEIKEDANNTNEIAQDSEELQALFDSTESLVNVEDNSSLDNKEQSFEGDCDELQAIFDATESLVDNGENKQEESEVKDEVKEEKPAPETAPAKKVENKKEENKAKAPPVQSIRVGIDVLEDLMQQASELVLTRNQLLQILRQDSDSQFSGALQRLSHITTELQEGVMKTRMQPVGSAWTKLPRIIRDLSMDLGKKIELKMIGEETELDRQLLDAIRDPLTHMIRNSADHGIESPEVRKESGKPETGTVELKAYQAGGYIIIEISDDGKGIDAEFIKNKAIDKGIVSESDADKMTDSEIFQFIFAPGFSTAEKVTSVSGRGVGMDVVKSNIQKISGTVELQSEVGKGSRFVIRIPLTLAIMSVLKVRSGDQLYAVPQINVLEIVKEGSLSDLKIEMVNNKPVLRIRGNILSLIDLKETLVINSSTISKEKEQIKEIEDKIEEAISDQPNTEVMDESIEAKDENDKDESDCVDNITDSKEIKTESVINKKEVNNTFIVICEVGGYKFGIIVDDVEDTEEIVVKPVSPFLKHVETYAGCTILGDGSVILILDPNSLSKSTGEGRSHSQNNISLQKEENKERDSSFVLFKSQDDTPKVVPLELLSRLEEIEMSDVEMSHGRPVIQYRGDLMRLINMDPNYEMPKEGGQDVLVFASNNELMGLIVEEITDIVKAPMPKKLSSSKEGFLGSMVINGKTSDVVDISYYFTEISGVKVHNFDDDEKAKTKILLVDDSPFFRKFIPMELEKDNFSVVVAEDGLDALEIIKSGQAKGIVAIVTDIDMPRMDGNQLLKECKELDSVKDIPIIALSAHSSDRLDQERENEGSGFDSYIPKTNHVDLLEVLHEVLKEKVTG